MAALNRTVTQLYARRPATRIEKDPDDRDINTEEQAMAAPTNSGRRTRRTRRGRGRGARHVQVKIEWDGIDRRITQLTRMPGSVTYVVPSPG